MVGGHAQRALTALAAVAALALGCRRPPEPFDDVVLVTLDTVRADHLGAYGYPRPTSPFLDRLATGGVLFEDAVAASSHTAPAHASLLTSRYPPAHGVAVNGQRLAEKAPTLAGALAGGGFETAAFVSVRFLQGLQRGFDHFDARTERPGRSRPADATVNAALDWLRGRPPAPRLFLWVHLYDAHETRDDSELPLDKLEAMRRWPRAGFVEFLAREHGVADADRPAKAEGIDRYDAQIAFTDAQLERLHRELEALRPDRRRLWVITSDHGEGLGSHGYCCHDGHLYREQIRVPLIVHGDGPWRPGRRIGELVRHVDLAPTVAALAGLPPDALVAFPEGRSLLPALAGRRGADPPPPAYAVRRPAREGMVKIPDGLLIAARGRRYKLLLEDGELSVFDLEADPLEQSPLDRPPPPARELARWLRDKHLAVAGGAPAAPDEELPPDLAEELRALGYVD